MLRADLGGDPAFAKMLERVRQTALDAYAHQDVPFERLVEELQPERSLAHPPLFQVMFALQNTPGSGARLAGLEITPVPLEDGTAKFDLLVALSERGGRLSGSWQYDTDLFDEATIAPHDGELRAAARGSGGGAGRRRCRRCRC